jgi:hypothetical protein
MIYNVADQAFSPSFALATSPSSPSPSPVSIERRYTGRLRRETDNLLTGEGVERLEEDPNHTMTARKPGSLQIIKYSLNKRRSCIFKDDFTFYSRFLS